MNTNAPVSKSIVKYSFHGAWAGVISGAIASAAVVLAMFVWGLASGHSAEFFGLAMRVGGNAGFEFQLDLRPLLLLTSVGTALGIAAGACYGRSRAAAP